MKPLAIIILAAGESSRMGTPKALAKLYGKPLLQRILENPFLERPEITSRVVLGHQAEEIQPLVKPPVEAVINQHYHQGRTTSIQAGIQALPDDIQAAFIWPVDCPLITTCVLENVASSCKSTEKIYIPSYEMKCGHPPLIGAAHFPFILRMEPDQPLRDLYQNAQDSIQYVEVHSDSIWDNCNTPESIQELQHKLSAREQR